MVEIPTDRDVYRMTISVKAEDIDDLDHVNNVVYVQSAHWSSVASEQWKKGCRWVVLRHVIEYHSAALMRDVLQGATWIEKPQGAIQKRLVRLNRQSDQKLICTAETSWCLLDPISGRPKRISTGISSGLGLKY